MQTLTELPPLESAYAVAQEKIDYFRDKGHVLLRGVASPAEVAVYRGHIDAAVERMKLEARDGAYNVPLAERDTYYRAFLQMENLWQRDEAIVPFTTSRRFGKIAADLLGVDGIRVYHDQALYKEAGGGHTPWHQDQYYWPLDTDQTVTIWLALEDATIESGSMVFADGSQRLGPLASVIISDESDRFYKDLVVEKDMKLTTNELRAGDATFHYGWTMHKAPGNCSKNIRKAMTIIYMADGTRVSEFKSERHPRAVDKWMTGLKPGDLVDSPKNPLVFKR